ncbi:cupredoxin domain-containing protein [Phenylobacterium sp.]|uniref:cupredoxin domain-containing protein n=1 Tax=Phenylobacterium sp. TaxID=1871053 RepID=UPI002DEE549B|nr:cupredoxin domain-containing protein [Phenylobacterium sp.]
MIRTAVRLAVLVGALALASCGKPAPATYAVTIANMAFGPAPAGLRVGDTIEWVNADIFQHSATAKDGSFDVDLAPKAHVRTVLARPGQVDFYCRYHPGMTGRLAVAR